MGFVLRGYISGGHRVRARDLRLAGQLAKPAARRRGRAHFLHEIPSVQRAAPRRGVLVESRRGAVTLASRWRLARFSPRRLVRLGMVLFPLPAHPTGHAHFGHPALGESSRFRPRKASGPLGKTDQSVHFVERLRRETLLSRPYYFVLGT